MRLGGVTVTGCVDVVVGVGRREPVCVIDRSRSCGGCVGASPRECPYVYLLDRAELSALARGGSDPTVGRVCR